MRAFASASQSAASDCAEPLLYCTPTSRAASATSFSAWSICSSVCEAAMQKRARESSSGVAG